MIVLKLDSWLGANLNSQTGSAAELSVPVGRFLHSNLLVSEEMNKSLSAVAPNADAIPSRTLQDLFVALVNAASGLYRYKPTIVKPAAERSSCGALKIAVA